MSRRWQTTIPPSTPLSRCRWLESKIRAVGPFETLFPFSGTQKKKCLCLTIATMFSKASRRDSQDLCCCFFPRGCTFSMVKTIASCPFHQARATFTTAVGKVAKSARWCPPGLSRCWATHPGFSLKGCSSLLLSGPRVVCSMSPVFSVWHCVHPLLSDATRILWHAGGWRVSRKPCVFLSFSVFSIGSACDDLSLLISGSRREIPLHALLKIWRSCNYVKLLFGFSLVPLSQAPALFSTENSGYALACSKSTTSWCVESGSYLCWLRFEELPQDFRCVVSVFVRVRVSLLATDFSEASLCPMSGWVCQWKPFWIPVKDSFRSLCGRVGLHQRCFYDP